MHSVLSTSSRPTPRKSSSFLSLRREKDKAPSPPSIESTPLPLPTSSSSYMQSSSYPDQHSRPKSSPASRSSKGKSKYSPSPKPTLPHIHRPYDTYDRPSSSPRTGNDSAYAFPMFESSEDLATPTASSYTYVRTRSRTGPSGKSHWDDALGAAHLRFSGSSSTQHTETPPRTPIDYAASRDSFEQFPVVVAAPVAGVDVMDALVDGMNGGDGGSLSMSGRSRLGIPNHHPLYHPPLPTPPPGLVLGGGKPRRTKPKLTERHSSDSSEGEDHLRNMSGAARKGRRRTRPPPSRTTSDATIAPPSIPSPAVADGISISTNPPRRVKNEVSRVPSTVSLPEKPSKTVVPSISDIIRTYAPKEAQLRTRPSPVRSASLYNQNRSNGAPHEEPVETPSPKTEGDVPSRSSLDSIADEVQQTLKNQAKMKPITSVPPSSFPKRHSTISDNASIYSPRSDPGGPTPSLYSSSMSYHQPASPYEASFLTTTPSQAVAQYLRSARLTTLLKLTRSPHASADNPLTVSLSDLGSRTGYPIIVFLGLGCVRHIMGLYDEMAECMGLRLITIDR